MRAIAKILRARASEHSSKFCEQIEQRPNLRAAEKFYDHSIPLLVSVAFNRRAYEGKERLISHAELRRHRNF